MLRFKWTSFGPWLDEDGPFVLFADAEAAIEAAQADATVLQAFQRGVKAGYATGLTDVDDLVRETKADMLAKCIAAVEAQQMYASTVEEIMVGFDCAKREILRALRALQEKP